MINQIRYQQQYQQLQSLPKPGQSTVATYEARNSTTGQRSIQTADGGTGIAQYLSNSQPGDVLPLSQPSTIGLSGYISQKPY